MNNPLIIAVAGSLAVLSLYIIGKWINDGLQRVLSSIQALFGMVLQKGMLCGAVIAAYVIITQKPDTPQLVIKGMFGIAKHWIGGIL